MNVILLVFLFAGTLSSKPFNYVADWPQKTMEDGFADTDGPIGPLRQKADEYDKWNAKYHRPYYGGLVDVAFTDTTYEKVADYGGTGDSCIWTGTYLGSQAFRYLVTKDPDAKINIIKTVHALDGYLHSTNVKGYIARYWGPQNSLTYKGDEWCAKKDSCRKITSGKYAGDYWEGLTTKDQYQGWFFGMGLAYDAIDDVEVKKMIAEDIVEVVDQLIKNNWIIINDKGEYNIISAGPRPSYVYQLSWLSMAYHITGDPKYKKELEDRLVESKFLIEEIGALTESFSVYNQYYAFNLIHTTWYNLLRLGKVYFSPAAYQRLKGMFSNNLHPKVIFTHNPWFNTIFMTQGDYTPKPGKDPHMEELLQDLSDFRPAPNAAYYLPARDPKTYELDQATSWMTYFPRLREILSLVKLNFKPQAKKAFTLPFQCHSGFMFQRSPYVIEECGSKDKRKVAPGHDYLVTYWMASFHKLLNLSQ